MDPHRACERVRRIVLAAAALAATLAAIECAMAAAGPSVADPATPNDRSKIDPVVHEWFSANEGEVCLLSVTLDIGRPLRELPWVDPTPEVRRWEEAVHARAHDYATAAVEEGRAAMVAARTRGFPATDAVVSQLLVAWQATYAHNVSIVQDMLSEAGSDMCRIEGVARVAPWARGTMSPEVLVWGFRGALRGIAAMPRVLRITAFADVLDEMFDLAPAGDDDPTGDYYKVHREVTDWINAHSGEWCRVYVELAPGKPFHDNRWRPDTVAVDHERVTRDEAGRFERAHGDGSVSGDGRALVWYEAHR